MSGGESLPPGAGPGRAVSSREAEVPASSGAAARSVDTQRAQAWAPGSADLRKGDASVISTQTRARHAAGTPVPLRLLNKGRQRLDFRARPPVCCQWPKLREANIKARFPACLETSKRPATLTAGRARPRRQEGQRRPHPYYAPLRASGEGLSQRTAGEAEPGTKRSRAAVYTLGRDGRRESGRRL